MFDFLRRILHKEEWLTSVDNRCMREDYCPCPSVNRPYCEKCTHYRWFDSGYGYCVALPEVVFVPWCRIVCGLFTARK